MAITGRTATRTEAASASSITATLPSDIVAGDLCLAIFALTNPGTITAPSGWTALFTPSGYGTSNTVALAVYYRFSPPSAPALSHTGGAGRISVLCQAWGGVNASTPIDVTPVVTSGTGTSLVANGVTTATAGALLLSATMRDIGSSTANPVIPSGMTSVVITGGGNNGRLAGLAQEARPTAGASGTRTWSDSSGATLNSQAFVTALRPAVAASADVSASATAVITATAGIARAGDVTAPAVATITATAARTRYVDATVTAVASITPGVGPLAHADVSLEATASVLPQGIRGTSAAVLITADATVITVAGGKVYVWTGAAFTPATVRVRESGAWLGATVQARISGAWA